MTITRIYIVTLKSNPSINSILGIYDSYEKAEAFALSFKDEEEFEIVESVLHHDLRSAPFFLFL